MVVQACKRALYGLAPAPGAGKEQQTCFPVVHHPQAAGQVPFWTPDVVDAFLALLRLHATLAHCATLDAQPEASGLAAGHSSGRSTRHKKGGSGGGRVLLGTMAQLLLGRPELLGLVGQVRGPVATCPWPVDQDLRFRLGFGCLEPGSNRLSMDSAHCSPAARAVSPFAARPCGPGEAAMAVCVRHACP